LAIKVAFCFPYVSFYIRISKVFDEPAYRQTGNKPQKLLFAAFLFACFEINNLDSVPTLRDAE